MIRGIRELSKSIRGIANLQFRGKSTKSGDKGHSDKGHSDKGHSNKGTGITYSYSYSDSLLFKQRRKLENEWKTPENEWNDDEHEQQQIFDQENNRMKEGNFKCEITKNPKRPGTVHCNCESMCMAKMSETFLIHYEGGVGIILKNKK